MATLNIITTTFDEYTHSVGEWVKIETPTSTEFAKVQRRAKKPVTLSAEDLDGPVYEVEIWDEDASDFNHTDVMAQSDLSECSEPPEMEDQDDSDGLAYSDDGNVIEPTFAAAPLEEAMSDGFNEYGIRKNTDEQGNLLSVDAIYEAMEPGPPKDRNGFRITKDFLRTLAEKDYSRDPPYMMDHAEDTLSQIGFVQDIWFDEDKEKLMVQARAYNTGGDIHDEIINRLTHEPPATPGGSVGLGQSYEAKTNDAGEVELVDAKIEEFSTTPFPGGYDEGGLRASGAAD